jgi:hypothetical protein
MADLVMLALVNHVPYYSTDERIQEIPIKMQATIFNSPNDDKESTADLQIRTRNKTEIIFHAPRRLPIERIDEIVLEGQYKSDMNDYQIRRIHLLHGMENGRKLIYATFNIDRGYNHETASRKDLDELGVSF